MKLSNVKIWIILISFSVSLAACNNDDSFLENDFDPIDTITETNNDTNTQDQSTDGALTLYRVNGNELNKIKDFNVSNNLISFQQNYNKHIKMWNLMVNLVPYEDRSMIKEYEVLHGGNALAGYVAPIQNDLNRWKLGLAIDLVSDPVDEDQEFIYTSIHEYGHLLTLNGEQIDQTTSHENCGNYFPGEGCSLANSYINAFFSKFWADIYDEFSDIDPDDYEEANQFYQKYNNRFVSAYAATNPGEDIAETFAVFVTQDKPTSNSIADQKIKFMYEYPDLIRLRNHMKTDVAARVSGDMARKSNRARCSRQHHHKQISSVK